MYHIKVRRNGKWHEIYADPDVRQALAIYNACPVPKMFLGRSPKQAGILHKQYKDNGFHFNPDWSRE